MGESEFEAAADDPLHNPMFARAGQAAAHGKIQFPIGGSIHVQGGEDQVVLLVERPEVVDRPGLRIILESRRQSFRQVVGYLQTGLETQTAVPIRAPDGFGEVRVQREIPLADVFLENRPDFQGDCVGVELVFC